MRSKAHAQLKYSMTNLGLHPSNQIQEIPRRTPAPLSDSCCARHRGSFESLDFVLEGRNEACGQATEASADLPDFLE